MGGLRTMVESLVQKGDRVAYRPAEVYGVGAHAVFNVTGPVIVYLFGGRATAAAGGAATAATLFNGVAGEAGAVAINGAVGTVWVTPLNVAGVIAGAAEALPLTTDLLHPPQGMVVGVQPAAVGVITLTIAVDTWTGDLFCVYRSLSPNALIVVA